MRRCSRGSVGRRRKLAALPVELDAERSTGRGPFVLIRGRRRVGKSWLVEEFLARHALPNVFFTATRNATDEDLPRFADALAQSSLPDDARAHGVRFAHWEADGRPVTIEHIDRRDIDNIRRRVVNIETARRMLRWSPQVTLGHGLQLTAEWLAREGSAEGTAAL